MEPSSDTPRSVAVRIGPLPPERSDDSGLLLHRVLAPVPVLGPGLAAVVWVQGCAVGCSGCMSPHTWDRRAGRRATITAVADWLLSTDLSCLTLSGGEPTDQAPALASLIDRIRADRDWTVTCYSGHTLAALRRGGRPGVAALLDRLDLLVDGPYVPQRHAALLWRGSSNQRIHRLTDRVSLPADEPAGLLPLVADDGSFAIVGVPPVPDLTDRLAVALGGPSADTEPRDASVTSTETAFPFPTTPPEEN